MSEITLKDVEALASDPAAINAAKTVFQAMAYEKTVSDIVKPEQRRLLKQLRMKDGAGEAITDPERSYNANDNDFAAYMDRMHEFYIAKGFNVELGYCPLLIAEKYTRTAKRVLIDVCEPFTGINFDALFSDFPNRYNSYIDIILRLLSKSVKS